MGTICVGSRVYKAPVCTRLHSCMQVWYDRSFCPSLYPLFFVVPPNITNDVLVDHAVDKGSDLVLDCNATGVQDPTYTWFFNGQNLTEVNNERIQVNQSIGVLIVRETVFFDYGNYTCFAGNEVGNDTQDNTIVIQGLLK